MGEIYDAIDASERSLVDLLIRLNIVTQQQVTEALEFQCRLPRSQYQKLEDILVEMEHLSRESLEQALQLSGQDLLPGQGDRRSQLQKSLRLSEEPPETRFVSADDLAAALAGGTPTREALPSLISEIPSAKPDWEKLFQDDEPDPRPKSRPAQPQTPAPDQLPAASPPEAALDLPAEASAGPHGMSGGVRVAGAFAQRSMSRAAVGWANPQTRPQLPTAPKPAPVPVNDGQPRPQLGEILLKNHDLEEWQLTHALCIQRAAPQTTPKLGTLLVRLGYVQPQAVERALSLQVNQA